jgi:hypothetical protein
LMLLTKVCEAHFSIMHQLAVIRSYIEKHLQELHEKNQDEDLIMKQHKLRFTTWLKDPQGVEINDYGFTIIDPRNLGHKDEPWVLAATIAQVFYIHDPKDEKKYIVVLGKQ